MLIHVRAEYGLYSRPEFSADRVSYPVPPFSTVKGMLEAFYWKRGVVADDGSVGPSVVWRVDRVYVLSEVRYVQIMRNERMIEEGSARTQRRALFVKAPSYVVQATPTCKDRAQENKALDMAHRWLTQGRTRQGLFLGSRECVAYIGTPPLDYERRAVRVNRGMPPLGRMPTSVLYDEQGTPLGTEWGDYEYDRSTGSYSVVRESVVVPTLRRPAEPPLARGGSRARVAARAEPVAEESAADLDVWVNGPSSRSQVRS